MKSNAVKKTLLIVGIVVFGLLSAVLIAADVVLLSALWS